MLLVYSIFFFFFFNDTATTEIYTLSLHDALPICRARWVVHAFLSGIADDSPHFAYVLRSQERDRKSTRLNSSHLVISYAVFCLKKKKTETNNHTKICARCSLCLLCF